LGNITITQTNGLRLVVFAAIVVLLHLTYSIAPNLPENWRPLLFHLSSAALALTLAFGFAQEIRTRGAARLWSVPRGLVQVLIPWVFSLSAYYFSLPNSRAIWWIIGSGTATMICYIRRRPDVALVVNFSMILLLLAYLTATTMVDVRVTDMLPMIHWAGEQFLAGQNPYYADYTVVSVGPFYYLPVQWLTYLPFVYAGLDPRILNGIAIAGVAALFWVRTPNDYRGVTICCLLLLLASRPVIEMTYEGHVWPLWFLVSLAAFLLSANRLMVSAVTLGLLLAMQQTMLLPAACIGASFVGRLRTVRVLVLGGVSLLVFAVLVVPFAHGILAFFRSNYVTLPSLAGRYNAVYQVMQTSLLNLTYWAKLSDLRLPLQIAVAAFGIVVIFAHRFEGIAKSLSMTGLTFLATISLNIQIWKYYYIPGLLLLLWSIVVDMAAFDRAPDTARLRAAAA
jgi:hypothetical protein